MAKPTARSVAASVLARVDDDEAFAAAALSSALSRAVQLDPRDRALATELVYGVLRLRPWLSGRVGRHLKKGRFEDLDGLVARHLLVCAYQLLALSRVPAFAAVNEAVLLVRGVRGPKVAGFANAVLRKLAAEGPASPIDLVAAQASSLPRWLLGAFDRALGEEGRKALLAATLSSPAVCVRTKDVPGERERVVARLREGRPEAEITLGVASPRAILLRGAGAIDDLPGWKEGEFLVQEEGSQVVAASLAVAAGERVLDACAGRGNKTSLLAEAGASVDAADLHGSKLERLEVELARLGLAPRRTFAVDWTVGQGDADPPYDAILLDAPCSGTGTFARRPDVLLRKDETSLGSLAGVQKAILSRMASLLRPGGRLVYAVCSFLREEAEDVVDAALLDPALSLALAPFPGNGARALAEGGSTLRLLPHVHGTDGYFLASFVKR